MEYPKISIVTPSYNQGDYLEQTIRSVLDQNYPNLEYVIIDGGSTDRSVEIIKKYADSLTYWVSEKDKGQYDAINKGFAHTTGNIMGWINSSDVHYPWTLQTIAEVFEMNSEVEWISGMPTNLKNGIAPQSIFYGSERNIYDIIAGDYKWIQQESVFWKRGLWNKAGGKLDINIRFAEDFHLWLKFFRHTNLYYVNTILGGFRYHDVRRGGGDNDPYSAEVLEVFKRFRSQTPLKMKMRASVAKLFFKKNRLFRRIINKMGMFPWYRHYTVVYDYSVDRWEIRVQ